MQQLFIQEPNFTLVYPSQCYEIEIMKTQIRLKKMDSSSLIDPTKMSRIGVFDTKDEISFIYPDELQTYITHNNTCYTFSLMQEEEPAAIMVPQEEEPAAMMVPQEEEPAAMMVPQEEEPAAMMVPQEEEPAAMMVPQEEEPAAMMVPQEEEPLTVAVYSTKTNTSFEFSSNYIDLVRNRETLQRFVDINDNEVVRNMLKSKNFTSREINLILSYHMRKLTEPNRTELLRNRSREYVNKKKDDPDFKELCKERSEKHYTKSKDETQFKNKHKERYEMKKNDPAFKAKRREYNKQWRLRKLEEKSNAGVM